MAYVSGGPSTDFENSVQAALTQANAHFLHEEFALALDSYRELSNLILALGHPALPLTVSFDPEFQATRDPSILDAIVGASARMLTASAVPRSRVPSAVRPGQNEAQPFRALALEGLVHAPIISRIDTGLSQATAAAAREDWNTAPHLPLQGTAPYDSGQCFGSPRTRSARLGRLPGQGRERTGRDRKRPASLAVPRAD